MLHELRIRNFAIIDQLELTFATGLNIITGETGAGKSIILDALGMLLGNLLGFILSLYFTLNPYRLPGDLYFITALPAQMKTFDFVWVSIASLLTTLVAGFIPARRAANIQPARIIR